MMSNAIAKTNSETRGGAALMEQVVIGGDLSKLSAADRLTYYRNVCESVGLNPLTKPFDYLTLSGRMVLSVSYTHLRAHETVLELVCRLLLEKKKGISQVLAFAMHLRRYQAHDHAAVPHH